jgi:hypothetical protein
MDVMLDLLIHVPRFLSIPLLLLIVLQLILRNNSPLLDLHPADPVFRLRLPACTVPQAHVLVPGSFRCLHCPAPYAGRCSALDCLHRAAGTGVRHLYLRYWRRQDRQIPPTVLVRAAPVGIHLDMDWHSFPVIEFLPPHIPRFFGKTPETYARCGGIFVSHSFSFRGTNTSPSCLILDFFLSIYHLLFTIQSSLLSPLCSLPLLVYNQPNHLLNQESP